LRKAIYFYFWQKIDKKTLKCLNIMLNCYSVQSLQSSGIKCGEKIGTPLEQSWEAPRNFKAFPKFVLSLSKTHILILDPIKDSKMTFSCFPISNINVIFFSKYHPNNLFDDLLISTPFLRLTTLMWYYSLTLLPCFRTGY